MDSAEKIINVNMGTLTDNVESYYSDDEVILFGSVAEMIEHEAFMLDIVIMMFCTNGKIQVRINQKDYTAEKDDLIICMPKSIVENIMVSPDFNCSVIGLSFQSMKYAQYAHSSIWNMRLFFMKTPVVHLPSEQSRLGELYYALLAEKFQHPNKYYHKEIIHSIFQSLFYELVSQISPQMEHSPIESEVKQSDLLFKKFLEMLIKEEGRERSVARFADMMNVTPKYLSAAVKEASGKTALQWIHKSCMEAIIRQLKYTDRTIKEVANQMNFPNISFFGKFVKNHMGISPTEYRRQLREQSYGQ